MRQEVDDNLPILSLIFGKDPVPYYIIIGNILFELEHKIIEMEQNNNHDENDNLQNN